jgi:hypothetical protein
MPLPVGTQLFANNAISLLAAPITVISTSLTVITGHGALYPQPTGDGSDFFLITLEDQSATTREIIKVTGRVGDTLLFNLADRGQEGTTVQAWSSNPGHETLVDHRVTAETMQWAMQLPVSGPSSSTAWINGANTLSTPIDQGWQLPISMAAYSDLNRTFKFFVTIKHTASHQVRAFEVMLTITGNVSANTEVVHATQYATVGPKLQGDLHASLNTTSKYLSLEWSNDEATPVLVHVTRIQHFPV